MDYRMARILRFLLYILFGLLILFLLIAAFNGIKGSFNRVKPAPLQTVKLSDYKNSSSQMRFVSDGTIQAKQLYTRTVISVAAGQSTVQVFKGDNSVPVLSQSFANNQENYNQFLDALAGAAYTQKQVSSTTNRNGSCPVGSRFSYQIVAVNSGLAQDTWNTSCSKKTGDFGGNTALTQQLFKLQIPNYSSIVSSVD